MNKYIDLKTVLEGAGKGRSEQLSLFALLSLGIVESLSNGLLSAAECPHVFFHADNCLFVAKTLRVPAAGEIMSRGVQLADLFDVLPPGQAQREFSRELAKLRNACLKLLEQKRLAA